ncbi:MAG: MASE3 domain-containing sensor histidine kinase [Bacillota bacterium]
MEGIAKGEIFEILYESEYEKICKVVNAKTQSPVILKILKDEEKLLSNYKLEYEITSMLGVEGVLSAKRLEKTDGFWILEMEYFNGTLLLEHCSRGPVDFNVFFDVSIGLCSIIEQLHYLNVIHNSIKPKSILYDSKTHKVALTGFGNASVNTGHSINSTNLLNEVTDIYYISPEQTGRMNCSTTHRTDFYSLGIVFYQMLTGMLPFDTSDPIEILHSHMARKPFEPYLFKSYIPKTIYDILMKLLSKDAADRYNTAAGLKHDLLECKQQWEKHGTIKNFKIGSKDTALDISLPSRIYGRDREQKIILDAYNRVKMGTAEMIVINGSMGIGASSLVTSVRKIIEQDGNNFIAGRFEKERNKTPYFPISVAFGSLIKKILMGSEESIALWRKKLIKALGINGQIIVDIIPDVELIIGKQPPVMPLKAELEQNRFNFVFQRFLNSFSDGKNPLVIYFSDVQWADNASIKLLSHMLSSTKISRILLICTITDADNYRAGFIKNKLKKMALTGASLCFIDLKPLELADIEEFVKDAFNKTDEETYMLSRFILDKTNGIPLIIKQLIRSLYKDGLIYYSSETNSWDWDINRIRVINDIGSSYGLIEKTIERASRDQQKVLMLASCIGVEFDLQILHEISDIPVQQLNKALMDCIASSLLLPVYSTSKKEGQRYRFLHNSIMQAASDMLTANEKAGIYLNLGRVLLNRIGMDDLEDSLYDILYHLNHGKKLIVSSDEKLKLAELNLRAGAKAKKSNAYLSAIHYYENGLELLPKNAWENYYKLVFELNLGLCECKYYSNDILGADLVFAGVAERLNNSRDTAELYTVKINYYSYIMEYKKSIEFGKECLERLGKRINMKLSRQGIKNMLADFLNEVTENEINELYKLQMLQDTDIMAVMKILESMITPAIHVSKQLLAIILYELVSISMKNGNTVQSSIGYTIFGMLIATEYGYQQLGYQFGRLGCKLVDELNAVEYKAKIYQGFGVFSNLVEDKLVSNVNYLLQAQKFAYEIGDLVFIGYNACHILTTLLMNGCHIGGLLNEVEENIESLSAGGDSEVLSAMTGIKEALLILKQGDVYDLDMRLKDCKSSISSWYYVFLLQSCYIMGYYEDSLILAKGMEKHISKSIDQIQSALYYFYYILSIAASYGEQSEEKKKHYAKKMENNLKELKRWSEISPSSFSSLYILARAEKLRVTGSRIKPHELYEQAIKNAHENEYVHYTALGYELMSRYFKEKGHELIAAEYLMEAQDRYDKWGANAKAQKLMHEYEQLKSRNGFSPKHEEQNSLSKFRSKKGIQALDIETVIKATQAISSEIVFENIIEKLIKLSIESAGAQRCVFLKPDDSDKLYLKGEYNIYTNILQVSNEALEKCDNIPKGLINYVFRTKHDIVLDDAANDGLFIDEEYISAKRPKSVLCVPVVYRAKSVGVFYLENNLITRAFTADRVEFLKIIFSQAAISIENAINYKRLKSLNQELEQKVEERTKELKETVIQLQQEINERKAAEKALQENEERLNTLINAIPDVIYFKDGDGKLIEMNSAAVDLICNCKSKSECMLTFNSNNYAGDIDFIRNESDEISWSRKEITKSEELIKQSGKSKRVFDVIKVPLFDGDSRRKGLVVVGRDISERKMIERHLSESEERYRTLVELSPISIMVFSRDRVIYSNIAGVRLLGYDDRRNIIGKRMMDLLKPAREDRANFSVQVKNAINNGHIPPTEQRIVRRSDGRTIDVETTATSFYYNGEKAVLVVSKDISERKMAEILKLRSEENLKLLKEAMEYDKLKTEFFSNISHELKTPLNVILGSLQLFTLLLKDSPDWQNKNKLNKYSTTMKQNCYRLLRLVNNLIDITKIDSGFFTLNLQNYNIINVVEEITLSVADYVESKSLRLEFDTEVEEKLMACDPDKIERILLNLLSNSIKFSRSGGIIKVNVQDKGEKILISVKDDGIGIPDDKQQLIFERFRQVDKSFVRNHEGSGIGLALVKSLVELHEGSITLKSRLNEGSEFIIELPVRSVQNEASIAEMINNSKEDKIEKIQIEFSDIYFNN